MKRSALAAAAGTLAALSLIGCGDNGPKYTAEGRAWKESFYENFNTDIAPGEANCMAEQVGGLARMVGPLVGQRPDDTPGSVWAAVDTCLSTATQALTARAIVLGGWAGEEPSTAGIWNTADDLLGECMTSAGGWAAIGSYDTLITTCNPVLEQGTDTP